MARLDDIQVKNTFAEVTLYNMRKRRNRKLDVEV